MSLVLRFNKQIKLQRCFKASIAFFSFIIDIRDKLLFYDVLQTIELISDYYQRLHGKEKILSASLKMSV